ncbi:MAG TPA: hypothetical protein DHV79_08045 [Lachnospiraceae bacterium]|nr:hypothetical protein [Lachnospiraceae bacterium]
MNNGIASQSEFTDKWRKVVQSSQDWLFCRISDDKISGNQQFIGRSERRGLCSRRLVMDRAESRSGGMG